VLCCGKWLHVFAFYIISVSYDDAVPHQVSRSFLVSLCGPSSIDASMFGLNAEDQTVWRTKETACVGQNAI